MKKILIGLTLSGLFAVLLVPMTASVVTAAACPTGCRAITSSNTCECGATALPRGTTTEFCDNGVVRSSCLTGGTTGRGEQPPETAPTVVTSGAELLALITTMGNWVFVFLLAVAAIFLTYAGFLWVTAGGNPEGATKARQMLTNALIGVVIALLARGIVQVIRSVIEG